MALLVASRAALLLAAAAAALASPSSSSGGRRMSGAAGQWKSAHAGKGASCALDQAGGLWCAGSPLENGNAAMQTVMQPVGGSGAGGLVFKSISVGGGHTLGILANGSVVAFGRGDRGQLGNGAGANSATPVLVAGLPPSGGGGGGGAGAGAANVTIVAVAAGYVHSVALDSTGALHAWGAANNGQLGYGGVEDQLSPVLVSSSDYGTNNYTAVSCGGFHTCMVDSAGSAVCMGSDAFGQLGLPTSSSDALTPVRVQQGGFTAIATGYAHTCAIKAGGVLCWGKNDQGQCGNGNTPANVEQPTPISAIAGASAFVSVVAGYAHTLLVAKQAPPNTWAFGSNAEGQAGTGDNKTPYYASGVAIASPAPFTSLSWAQLSAGWNHNCGVDTSTGEAACWGEGGTGALGDGATSNVYNLGVPSEILAPSSTPTATSSATATATATSTGSSTGSATATSTGTSTATSTASASASASTTSTTSASASPSTTSTASASVSPSTSSTATGTATASASISPSASLSPSPTPSIPANFAPFVGLPVVPQYGSWLSIFAAGCLVVVVGAQNALCRMRRPGSYGTGPTPDPNQRYMRIMGRFGGLGGGGAGGGGGSGGGGDGFGDYAPLVGGGGGSSATAAILPGGSSEGGGAGGSGGRVTSNII